ncbi:unnamed protein product [Paramecium primaurelia]|uniref:Uncharacterized protein n=1 Tax=Paramecium primaurelia TaxID=5886 RepID=A0A8S1MAA5_PARPR|nr:unnamed protein product [Paramecium primaurelia]
MQPKRNINDLLAEYSKELGEDFDDVDPQMNEENAFDDDPEMRKLQKQLYEFYSILEISISAKQTTKLAILHNQEMTMIKCCHNMKILRINVFHKNQFRQGICNNNKLLLKIKKEIQIQHNQKNNLLFHLTQSR